jgi:hypothetical protein
MRTIARPPRRAEQVDQVLETIVLEQDEREVLVE